MAQRSRNKDEETILLFLLLLGFAGKGLGSTPAADMTSGTSTDTSKPTTDNAGMPNNGNSESPDTTGATSRQRPNIDMGSAPPKDKSNSVSPPNSPPPQVGLAGMMQKIVNLISPTPPKGGTVLPSGNIFIPNLDIYGGTSGAGSGASTPSITTVYGDKTYTNFNPALFTNTPTDKTNPSPVDPASSPMPSQKVPMMAAVMTMSKNIMASVQETIMFGSPAKQVITPTPIAKPVMPPVMMAVMPALPMGSPKIINPLPNDKTVLDQLIQSGEGFGQSVLNKILQSGQNLTGLFSGLLSPNPTIVRPISPIEITA